MKKILLIGAVLILIFVCNMIYAKQTNASQYFCQVENCPQAYPHSHNYRVPCNNYVEREQVNCHHHAGGMRHH